MLAASTTGCTLLSFAINEASSHRHHRAWSPFPFGLFVQLCTARVLCCTSAKCFDRRVHCVAPWVCYVWYASTRGLVHTCMASAYCVPISDACMPAPVGWYTRAWPVHTVYQSLMRVYASTRGLVHTCMASAYCVPISDAAHTHGTHTHTLSLTHMHAPAAGILHGSAAWLLLQILGSSRFC